MLTGRTRDRPRRWGAAVVAVSLGWLVAATPAGATAPSSGSWTVYHGDAAGSGASSIAMPFATSSPAWSSPALDGHLYGEPLVSAQRVFAATEANTVYALATSTGAILWSTHLARAVPAGSLPCGDIGPTVGITGTPVIDEARSEIFVVADEVVGGRPAHVLVGLDTTTGAVELTQNVDPPGANPAAVLQRTGLTLDAGQVVFGLGGNYGDCSTYRGRVVAVPEAGGTPRFFTVDAGAGQSEGAVWMGGAAPVVDANGDIWITAGNGSVTAAGAPYDNSDSALELSPSLTLLQYFAPVTWRHDNANDIDMSMAPALLSDGQMVVAGKSDLAFLLDRGHLGGIGGQEAALSSGCGDDVDGGSAVVGHTVYLPCRGGPIAVDVASSPPGLRVVWRARSGGGPPVVAGGLIWTIGSNGTLYGLDPASGAVRQRESTGAPANHFPTPGVGDGLLLVASANRVVAFAPAPSGAATAPSPAPSTTGPSATGASTTVGGAASTISPTAPGHTRRLGTGRVAAIVGTAVGAALAAVGGAMWSVRRRREVRRP